MAGSPADVSLPTISFSEELADRDEERQSLFRSNDMDVSKQQEEALPSSWPTYEPRVDFSQTADAVTIFFYVKGISPQDLHISGVNESEPVDGQPQQPPSGKCWTKLRFYAQDARKQVCYEKYIPFFQPVQAAYDHLKVSPVKIELRLLKLDIQQWAQLQRLASDSLSNSSKAAAPVNRVDEIRCSPKAAPTLADSKLSKLDAASTVSLAGSDTETNEIPVEILSGEAGMSAATIAAEQAGQLPGAYSGKRKNWDRLEREVIEEEEKEEPEGEAAAMKLFKKIYADGNEETRKAMMKSYYESGGTCLSTNWEDIGKRKVDVSPPDSMEFKQWEK